MKKLRPLLFIIFLFVIVWIDLPAGGIPVRFNVGNFKVDKKLPPAGLNLTLFGRKINRTFETRLGLDLKGGSHLVFEADMKNVPAKERSDALESARNIIERRVNFFGVSEPNVQTLQSGQTFRIAVDLPGQQESAQAVALIGQTAQLEFTELATDEANIATDTPLFAAVTKKTGLSGKHVKRAAVEFDQQGKPSVGLEFSGEGSKKFEEITKNNIGKPVGIFLDGFPLSIPVVQQAITGGQAVISGDFTLDQARQLAISINSGALPVSVKLIEQRSIGPTLGAKQVQASVFAGAIGLLAVATFMILYYGRLGIIATLALAIYGLFTFAIFRAIPVVLTLPGIAGFILSIGMAVDANILIFERIKEELRAGKEFDVARRLGFGRAIDAIKDANITTLLVAFILFNPLNWSFFPQFGLIKGFALTLAIGVATSLFTGVFITKRLINAFYRK